MTRLSLNRLRLYGALASMINAATAICAVFVLSATPTSAAERATVLALGDSLVAGYGLPKEESFPAVLEAELKALGHDVRVINGGVSGDTSKAGLSRVDWLFAEKPDLMLLELGANDGLRGLPPEDTERNLAQIIEKSQAAGVPVLLTGMLAPPNMGRDYGEAFNALYPRLAEKYGTAFYPFFLDGVAAEPELNQGDGMHPNAAGVEIIARRIAPSVIDALAAGSGS
ncbi:MAG: arylesterase [Pseudomonadota bacterium]|nr:arylesterase [Pseudomonadota bacterium]